MLRCVTGGNMRYAKCTSIRVELMCACSVSIIDDLAIHYF